MAHEIVSNAGDDLDESAIRTLLGRSSMSGYIAQDGIELTYYDGDDTIDVSAGTAYILDDLHDITLQTDAIVGYSLEANAVNHVWIAVDPAAATDDEAVGLVHNTTGVAPSDPSILIAEVDTNESGDAAITPRSRGTAPALEGADLNPRTVGDETPALSVGTEALNDVTWLLDSHSETDVRNAINNAASGAAFVVEPGASWELSGPLRPPTGASIVGHGNLNTRPQHFRKAFDGALVEMANYVTLHQLALDGNKEAGWTGPIIDNPNSEPNTGGARWELDGVDVQNAEGHGVVAQSYLCSFRRSRFRFNGGYGIHFPPTPDGETPHHEINGPCQISDNDLGGINIESDGKNITAHIVCNHNGGPAITDAGTWETLRVTGQLAANDGPAYLSEGSTAQIGFQQCLFQGSAQNPDSSLTTPVGHIHVESGSPALQVSGGTAKNASQLFSAPTGSNHRLTIVGNGVDRLEGAIDGANTYLTIVNRGAVAAGASSIAAQTAVAIDPALDGRVLDPTTGDEIYVRA